MYAGSMDDSEIERALIEAQTAVTADQARVRRREVVMQARAAGWSKYRIAAVLGVKGPTVDAIIASAEASSAPSERS
jgi:DNA-directed RNA polymerase specialized sigma24 family protein